MLKILGLVLVVSACGLTSNIVKCEDGRVCPEATVCDEQHTLCVLPEQIEQCSAQPDRTRCNVAGALGSCHEGVCLEAGCGNGREDLEEASACVDGVCVQFEVCDDGNNMDGDGCAGNCLSDESCGNLTVDAVAGETCDDGNLLDHDDCSSACRDEIARWVQVGSPGLIGTARAVYDAARDRVVMFGGIVYTAPPPANPAPPVTAATNAVSEWDGLWHRSIPTVLSPSPRDKPFTSSQTPIPTYGLAYDHERRLTVMTGGLVNGVSSRETWGWDGDSWRRLADMPVRLDSHAMAYDARRKRIVVVGGQTTNVTLSPNLKTFEFDGSTWFETTATGPTEKGATLAYDPKRGIMVMYGGTNDGRELWEYDGTSWTLRVPGNPQNPPLVAPAMAFDSVSNRMVIYGASLNTQKMLLWNGSLLTPFTGALPIAPASGSENEVRQGAILVPDGTGRLLLYGGQDQGNFFTIHSHLVSSRLLWFFDGTAWVEADADPPAGVFLSMTVDMNRGLVTRFSGSATGNGGPPVTGETWERSRRGWRLTTSASPPGLAAASLVYDTGRDESVLFGGLNSSSQMVDTTWTRSGSIWVAHPATGTWPSGRFSAAMVYDAARAETLMFGGFDTDELADTWVWNGTAWTLRTPAVSPSGRANAAIGYDPIANVVVLFSGVRNGVSTPDTWIWDGTNWHDVTASSIDAPASRSGGTLAWNPARQRLVLTQEFVGGGTFETWEWKTNAVSPPSGQWSPLAVSTRPPPRGLGASHTTLDGSGVTVAYGGVGGTVVDEIWELHVDASSSDSCRTPFDVDGDNLIGCADPDCWRTCTPECPPGTSCPTAAPRCGDGMCGLVENCRICPQDCATCSDTRCGDFVCDAGEVCPGDCP